MRGRNIVLVGGVELGSSVGEPVKVAHWGSTALPWFACLVLASRYSHWRLTHSLSLTWAFCARAARSPVIETAVVLVILWQGPSAPMTARITYDPATDDARLHLAGQSLLPGQTTTKANSLRGPDAFVTLDWLDNHLVGIEIHDAKGILPTDLLHQAELASPSKVGTSA
jgi:hypothetical protein